MELGVEWRWPSQGVVSPAPLHRWVQWVAHTSSHDSLLWLVDFSTLGTRHLMVLYCDWSLFYAWITAATGRSICPMFLLCQGISRYSFICGTCSSWWLSPVLCELRIRKWHLVTVFDKASSRGGDIGWDIMKGNMLTIYTIPEAGIIITVNCNAGGTFQKPTIFCQYAVFIGIVFC